MARGDLVDWKMVATSVIAGVITGLIVYPHVNALIQPQQQVVPQEAFISQRPPIIEPFVVRGVEM